MEDIEYSRILKEIGINTNTLKEEDFLIKKIMSEHKSISRTDSFNKYLDKLKRQFKK